MRWNALQSMMCPKCGEDIAKISGLLGGYKCTKDCGFTISSIKFDELVEKMYNKVSKKVHIPSDLENSEALNNLGLEEDPEGFDNDDEVFI